jgi:hypothetical protein
MRKSIEEYDRIKKTIYNNKKAIHSSFVLPPTNNAAKNSKAKLDIKSKLSTIHYE